MLEVPRPSASHHGAVRGFDVEILSVATANPKFQVSQAEAETRARRNLSASQSAVAAV